MGEFYHTFYNTTLTPASSFFPYFAYNSSYTLNKKNARNYFKSVVYFKVATFSDI